jgi:hypothetical protein
VDHFVRRHDLAADGVLRDALVLHLHDKGEEQNLATLRATLAYAGGWLGEIPQDSLGWNPGNDQKAKEARRAAPVEETIRTGAIQETQANGFPTIKSFLVRKDFLFVSSGAILSSDGKKWLDTFASYAAKMPERIVVAERTTELTRPRPAAGRGHHRIPAAATDGPGENQRQLLRDPAAAGRQGRRVYRNQPAG